MVRKHGFTLIELLVVIAIISILAAIVVPQVSDWVNRSRMTKAVAEIQNVETALTKMLADADKSRFQQFFVNWSAIENTYDQNQTARLVGDVTRVMYNLLRQGNNVDPDQFGLRRDVVERLGETYMDLGLDPWGNQYQFYIGPWDKPGAIPFRSYRAGRELSDGSYEIYRYTPARKAEADAIVPGNPPPDNANGFPAPKSLPFYVFSRGLDNLVNQEYLWEKWLDVPDDHRGGGDDINNWDNARGWEPFYN